MYDRIDLFSFYETTVKVCDEARCCDICSKPIHVKCNNLINLDYGNLKTKDETSCCQPSTHEILSFCIRKINPIANIDLNLKNLLCKLYNLFEKERSDSENLTDCKCRDASYFSNLDVKLKSRCHSIFHLNISSIWKNFGNFNHLINALKLEFDVLIISEPRILKFQSCSINVSLQNYVIEQIPTKSTAGAILLYISKKRSYKTRLIKLTTCRSKKIESISAEVSLLKKINWLFDVYRDIHVLIYTHLVITNLTFY